MTQAMPRGDHARRDEVLVFAICLRACRAMQRLRQVRRRCHHAGAARTFAIGTEVKASSASACAWDALDRSEAWLFARLG